MTRPRSSGALGHPESPCRGTAPASLPSPLQCLLFHHHPPSLPPCTSSDLVLLRNIGKNVSPSGAPSVSNLQLCQTEAKPPNPFSFVTYIAIGSMDCAFRKWRGKCYYDNSSRSCRDAKHPLKKSSLTHMANGLHKLFLNQISKQGGLKGAYF